MSIRASDLAKSMIATVRSSLGRDWKAARTFTEPELRRLARVLVDLGKLASSGQITEDEARSLLKIHRNTTETVMLTVKGLGVLAVENAVNSALGVVRDAVNTGFGIELL